MLAGGYLHLVERVGASDTIRVVYLPAYFRDCGWSGVARAIRFGRTSAHAGDSEFIVVDIMPRGREWYTVGVFLSAHCSERASTDCRWFRGAELERFTWRDRPNGAPRIWIARGKHANYPTREACEAGHWRQDRCAPNPRPFVFPVERAGQNVGEARRGNAKPCLTAHQLLIGATGASPGAVECLWDARPFRGWQSPAVNGISTSYGVLLRPFLSARDGSARR